MVSAQSGFACSARDQSGIIQLRTNNITSDGQIDLSEVLRIPKSQTDFSRFALRSGDILFNNTNSQELVGRAAFVTQIPPDIAFSNHLTRLRLDETALFPQFVAHWLHFKWLSGFFAQHCVRWSGQAGFQTDRLLELQIPKPPLDEQKRIAERLRRLLGVISSLSQSNTMRSKLLGALRTSIFDSLMTKQSAKWPRRTIGDCVVEFKNGYGRRPKGTESGPIVLRIADVSSGRIDLANPRRGNLTKEEMSSYSLREGDVLIIRVNGSLDLVGKCIPVDAQKELICFNDHLMRARLCSDIDPNFFALVVNHGPIRDRIGEAASTSAGQKTVNQEMLGAIDIPMPNKREQEKAINQIESAFNLATGIASAIHQRTEQIAASQAALLRAAFSGQL